jgi:hypothetical protein
LWVWFSLLQLQSATCNLQLTLVYSRSTHYYLSIYCSVSLLGSWFGCHWQDLFGSF